MGGVVMDTHRVFRIASLLEGISLLVVAGISSPLKHFGGMENAAQVTGMIHGILWLSFVVTLMNVASDHNWPWKRSVGYFFLASVPFGFAWIEYRERGRVASSSEPESLVDMA